MKFRADIFLFAAAFMSFTPTANALTTISLDHFQAYNHSSMTYNAVTQIKKFNVPEQVLDSVTIKVHDYSEGLYNVVFEKVVHKDQDSGDGLHEYGGTFFTIYPDFFRTFSGPGFSIVRDQCQGCFRVDFVPHYALLETYGNDLYLVQFRTSTFRAIFDRRYSQTIVTGLDQYAGPGKFDLTFGTIIDTLNTSASYDIETTFESHDAPVTVPEPNNWLLMIAGFGLSGAALRRRRFQNLAIAQ